MINESVALAWRLLGDPAAGVQNNKARIRYKSRAHFYLASVARQLGFTHEPREVSSATVRYIQCCPIWDFPCSGQKMKAVLCLSLSVFVVAVVGELITPRTLTREIRADVLRGMGFFIIFEVCRNWRVLFTQIFRAFAMLPPNAALSRRVRNGTWNLSVARLPASRELMECKLFHRLLNTLLLSLSIILKQPQGARQWLRTPGQAEQRLQSDR